MENTNYIALFNLIKQISPDWIAVVISLVALFFSVKQFWYEKERNRKEATIHAFDQLEESTAILYLMSLSKKDKE